MNDLPRPDCSIAMNGVTVTLVRVATLAHRFRDFPWIDAD